MKQNEIVLKHLQQYGEISPMQAVEYGILSLSMRISELRTQGHVISTVYRHVTDDDGHPRRENTYRLDLTNDQ